MEGFRCDCVLDPELEVMQVDVVDGDNELALAFTKRPPRRGLSRDELEALEDAKEDALLEQSRQL